MISHITGGALGILALALCVILAAIHKNPYGIIGGVIFGISRILLYLGMGWSIFAVATPSMIIAILGKFGTVYMLAGGIAYTVGVIFYKLGAKHRYMHSVFHLFCVAGSLLHLMSVLSFL